MSKYLLETPDGQSSVSRKVFFETYWKSENEYCVFRETDEDGDLFILLPRTAHNEKVCYESKRENDRQYAAKLRQTSEERPYSLEERLENGIEPADPTDFTFNSDLRITLDITL